MTTVLRRLFLRELMAWPVISLIHGQESPTFSAEVKVVNILANVRDKRGRIIENLTKDDFDLFEEGAPQQIRYFSRQSDLPLTVALMVDTSMSQEHVLPTERRAASQFFRSALHPQRDDRSIVTFDTVIRLLDDIDELHVPKDRRTGTLLYDAVYSICEQKLSSKERRKIMIVLSDGVDFGSKANVDEAIGEAVHSDVVIYSILFSDATFYRNMNPAGPYSARRGEAVLKGMANATGGDYLQVTKTHSLEQIFDHIAEDLVNQYSIGFISNRPQPTKPEPRKLVLKAKQYGLTVQARKWYFSQP